MIIDFHTHAFPDKIAQKAIQSVAHAGGNMQPFHEGTIASLKNKMAAYGVDKAVVLNIATNTRQEASVNRFAIQANDDTIISFGSVHPKSEHAFEALDALKAAGIKGVKLHPDYQHFYVDDESVFPLYEKIASLGLITVFHAGIDIGYPEPVHCTPKRLAKILPLFQQAPVVAAHLGSMFMHEEVLRHLAGKNIYFDTAFSYSRVPRDYAKQIINKHGAEHILFGSDMPWSKSSDEIRFVESLDLSSEENDLIFHQNAQQLLFTT